ncbi:GlxA family transcriptional regulator [Vibrio fluvialis]|uniref:GlxA family transcriptional regulator n=1 Tax=Vibrio fluvialis TaxID=676 RepID=UPI00192CB514|nr:helix-turn-helix domain-containing protein [Vibrio fluvialis]MBL4282594.1 helix-turn-helix domain-containing protein [Vibrio fluvialis]
MEESTIPSPRNAKAVTPIQIGFILQPHFSLMAFTAAMDALITANLVHEQTLYQIHTYGIDSRKVLSDIGIDIATDATVDSLTLHNRGALDWLFVCGGYRCETAPIQPLIECLNAAHHQSIKLGSIWNGTIALAHAQALDNHVMSAVHPNSHLFIRSEFPTLQLASHTFEVSATSASCAGPNSAMEMMLAMIESQFNRSLVRAIREILSCDQASEGRQTILHGPVTDVLTSRPAALSEAITLMEANIEEPLSPEDLARCLSMSRRQLERLFQTHLEISPSRHYLKLRLAFAHKQLEESSESIIQIGLSSGFVSSSHFSNCFKDHFGYSPTQLRQGLNRKL